MTAVLYMPRRLRDDPPVRADLRCVQCGGERKVILGIEKISGSNAQALEQAQADPFCSAKCARAWHGCGLPVPYQAKWRNSGEDAA